MIYHPYSLEANVCRHCNNRCVSCSHASPWAKPYFMEPAQLEKDLAILSPLMKVEIFYCSGGEALLHPKIVELIKVAKASGISKCVAVLTNGRLLHKMPEEFWASIDFLRVTVYPNLDRINIGIANAMSMKFGFEFGFTEADRFFKQFTKIPVPDAFKRCPWKKECFTVHEGKFFLCPQSAFFPNRFMDLPEGTDGLSLNESLTEEHLEGYIKRQLPYRACEICLSYTQPEPWREAESEQEWKELSTI